MSRLELELLARRASPTVRGDRMLLPPPGAAGGRAGLGGDVRRASAADGSVEALAAEAGRRPHAGRRATRRRARPAAAGSGPPERRAPTAVLADVVAGRVTPEAAERDYAVVLDAAGGTVDRRRRRTCARAAARQTSRMSTPGVVVGVDIGGTFTDVVVARRARTPHRREECRRRRRTRASACVDGAARGARARPGSTGGRRGARRARHDAGDERRRSSGAADPSALVTTEGFGDLLALGRARPRRGGPLRPAGTRRRRRSSTPALTFEVPERVTAHGEVLAPLPGRRRRAGGPRRRRRAAGTVSPCACSTPTPTPTHEQRIGAALPRRPARTRSSSASSDVWPELREYERAMTTVVVRARRAGHGHGTSRGLQRAAGRASACAARSRSWSRAAASCRPPAAARRPVCTVESGGAAGVLAAGVGRPRRSASADVISFDMGGTTAKTGIVRDGRPALAHDFQIGGKGSFGGARPGTGVPVKTPVVDLAEVGAGGGSIAWVDPGGALRVGPRSAGADPGPACYGRGGTEPTVTDANLLLGYLDARRPGGRRELSTGSRRAPRSRPIAARARASTRPTPRAPSTRS